MKRLGIIIFILSHLFLNGQNLVNNPSFEILSNCGTQATLCVNWLNPTQAGTPDLYNTCISNRVPSNGYYFQWPKTGNSFVGIFNIEPPYPVREYLHTQFTSSLIANTFYYFRFYAVLSNFSKNASNNLAIYISSNSIYQSGTSNFLLNYIPQIKKFNNPIIKDTLNWIEISGVYQADGTENFMTIGNFNDNATTTTIVVDSNKTYGAYYFIDDVSVENITTPQWQYRDTTVYLGDSVLIGPAISGLNIDWFDMSSTFLKNAPGIYVKPTVNTSYQATETFNSAVYNHTVNVTVLPPLKVDEYEVLQNSFNVYPNPTQNKITISSTKFKTEELEIEIVDVIGKKHHLIGDKDKNSFSINLQSLDIGIYFIQLYYKQQLVLTRKIIKE
jgi:hypothetical protein